MTPKTGHSDKEYFA